VPDDTQESSSRWNELAGFDVSLIGCNYATERRNIMSTTNLTLDSFESTVTSDGITIVDFWAEWCGPCKMFGPIFEEVSDANPDVTFAKVDTEAEQQLAGSLGIMSIPTVMIFRDGIQLFAQPGALPKAALEDLLGQVRNLDMDEIRSQLAEEGDQPAE
jgi:thioredoxin 1